MNSHNSQIDCRTSVLEKGSFRFFEKGFEMTAQQIVVIKVGTDVLRDPFAFFEISQQVAKLKRSGYGVILVSSGGVAAGTDRVRQLSGSVGQYPKHLLAGIGARHLLNAWGNALALQQLDVMQEYLTYGNLRFLRERESIRSSLRRFAFDSHFVPLVNENDPVSAVEIAKMRKGLGDNDRLARIIACLVDATHILFVTAKGGVYTRNPDKDPRAVPIKGINAKKRHRLHRQTSGPSQNGSGGMQSKVNQASICARKGMRAGIIGFKDIVSFVQGRSVGTLISLA